MLPLQIYLRTYLDLHRLSRAVDFYRMDQYVNGNHEYLRLVKTIHPNTTAVRKSKDKTINHLKMQIQALYKTKDQTKKRQHS